MAPQSVNCLFVPIKEASPGIEPKIKPFKVHLNVNPGTIWAVALKGLTFRWTLKGLVLGSIPGDTSFIGTNKQLAN